MQRHDGESPLVLYRRETVLSPWVTIVEKGVQFPHDRCADTYHCLALADYVAIVAQTPDKLIPIIRQYRPAVETYTWEFPAGAVDPGEEPMQSCVRELKEETGLDARSVVPLGAYYTDTGRLENRQHVFYVEASDPDRNFVPESGIVLEFVTQDKLRELIMSGHFQHQLHLAALLLFELHEARLRPDQGKV